MNPMLQVQGQEFAVVGYGFFQLKYVLALISGSCYEYRRVLICFF